MSTRIEGSQKNGTLVIRKGYATAAGAAAAALSGVLMQIRTSHGLYPTDGDCYYFHSYCTVQWSYGSVDFFETLNATWSRTWKSRILVKLDLHTGVGKTSALRHVVLGRRDGRHNLGTVQGGHTSIIDSKQIRMLGLANGATECLTLGSSDLSMFGNVESIISLQCAREGDMWAIICVDLSRAVGSALMVDFPHLVTRAARS